MQKNLADIFGLGGAQNNSLQLPTREQIDASGVIRFNEELRPLRFRIQPRESLPGDSLDILENIVRHFSLGQFKRFESSYQNRPVFLAEMGRKQRRVFYQKFQALCDIHLYTGPGDPAENMGWDDPTYR